MQIDYWEKSLYSVNKSFVGYGEIHIHVSQFGILHEIKFYWVQL